MSLLQLLQRLILKKLKLISPTTLLMLCVLLMTSLLSGCKTSGIILPDDKYLQSCPVTYLPSKQSGKVTNKQVAVAGAANIDSLNNCNDDKAALRAWKEDAAKSAGKAKN